MKKNIPCFIPTMITAISIAVFGLTATMIGIIQPCITESEIDSGFDDSTIEIGVSIGREDILADKEELLVHGTSTPVLSEPPVENVVVDTETAETDAVVEEPVVDNKVIYYDVPLSESLQDYIFELCEARGLDPKIVIGVIATESKYNSDAVGDSGRSLGLMQIQPRWHQARMTELGCYDLLNPFENVAVGIDILGDLYDCSGSIEWALMAYNGGSGYADRLTGQGIVSGYVDKVMAVNLVTYESTIG